MRIRRGDCSALGDGASWRWREGRRTTTRLTGAGGPRRSASTKSKIFAIKLSPSTTMRGRRRTSTPSGNASGSGFAPRRERLISLGRDRHATRLADPVRRSRPDDHDRLRAVRPARALQVEGLIASMALTLRCPTCWRRSPIVQRRARSRYMTAAARVTTGTTGLEPSFIEGVLFLREPGGGRLAGFRPRANSSSLAPASAGSPRRRPRPQARPAQRSLLCGARCVERRGRSCGSVRAERNARA
jgi:hypothetical protein